VTTVRRFRSEHQVPPKAEVELLFVDMGEEPERLDGFVGGFRDEVMRLAGISRLGLVEPGDPGFPRIVVQGQTILLPLIDVIDVDAEVLRLRKQLGTVEVALSRAEKKLANPAFRDKAPEDIVRAEERKVERFEREAAALQEQLAELG
jgi:valyl-tRNA synthetase